MRLVKKARLYNYQHSISTLQTHQPRREPRIVAIGEYLRKRGTVVFPKMHGFFMNSPHTFLFSEHAVDPFPCLMATFFHNCAHNRRITYSIWSILTTNHTHAFSLNVNILCHNLNTQPSFVVNPTENYDRIAFSRIETFLFRVLLTRTLYTLLYYTLYIPSDGYGSVRTSPCDREGIFWCGDRNYTKIRRQGTSQNLTVIVLCIYRMWLWL